MMKLRHFCHPIRTTYAVKDLLAARLEMQGVAKQGERYFREDKRYNPSAVIEGFSSHIDGPHDDTALLERICTAYCKSVEEQKIAPSLCDATAWWQQLRQRSLRPVMSALLAGDLATLRPMYRNFFRDPCSAGLISVPYGMTRAYFGKAIKNVHRHYYLSDVLHRIEYWKTQTSGQFTLQELAAPQVGNPFGAIIEGTLVEAGAPYRHYCAQQIYRTLSSDESTVVEIGGGFGGMAYYLLRDRTGMKYINFDVPETIALASYYLIRAFPNLTFLLYGEEELNKGAIAQADVVLLPLFGMTRVPAQIAEASFSSHSMSDISQDAFRDYLNAIARMTKKYFLCMGVERSNAPVSESISRYHRGFHLCEKRLSGWHNHRNARAVEVQCLYQLEAAGAELDSCLPS
jgi:putative sugar O-methyltransferase